jgi:predicted metalloprotease with PDZ domain
MCLNSLGCNLVLKSSSLYHEHSLGIKITEAGGVCRVSAVYPNSVADAGCVALNDEILAVNGIQIKPEGNNTNFAEWCNYFVLKGEKINLLISSSKQ